jgi:hypothetical protein
MHLCPLCFKVVVPFLICEKCWEKKFGKLYRGDRCAICNKTPVPEPSWVCEHCWDKEWSEVDALVKSLPGGLAGRDLRNLTNEDMDIAFRLSRLWQSRTFPEPEGSVPCKGCGLPMNPEQGEICEACWRLVRMVREDMQAKKRAKRERRELRLREKNIARSASPDQSTREEKGRAQSENSDGSR